MAFIQKFFTGRQSYSNGESRIGELGRLWYDSITNTIRVSDGTPGGRIVSGASMGSTVYEGPTPPPNPQAGWLWWDSTSGDLFVYYEGNWVAATAIPNSTYTLPKATSSTLGGVEIGTNINIDGNGKISVDFAGLATETYVTNLLNNYNDLGNFVVNGTNLQSLSGTVTNADIILNPNGTGSVQVPKLKVGSGGSILAYNLTIEAFITSYQLVSIVASSTGPSDNLASGTYGNINGVPAPWTVFRLTPGSSGTAISAIQINDILTGAGIIPSVVGDRGAGGPAGLWDSYVIVNLDLAGLGQVQPVPGAVFSLTRPLAKPNFQVQSATGTDIFLDSQGLGDVIVNTNVLPLTTNISNLGSPTQRWKSVYIGPGTIYVLDETLGKDIALGARDGLLYVQNGGGLTVGEFTLIDNQIKIADSTREIVIGTTEATGFVTFNRPIKVQNNHNVTAFEVDRTGLTTIRTPSGISYQNATLSIIGTINGHVQPRPATYDGTLIQLTAQDGKSSRISSDSFGAGVYPAYAGRAARGTVDSPSAMISGDVLSRFSSVGYGSTAYMTGIARFDAIAAENFSDSAAGTKFSFQNAPVGTTAAQVSATIDSTGLKFTESVDTNAGITFRNGDRLTYFPTPVGHADYYLKSNGTTMSWQAVPVPVNSVVYKGSWDANGNSPVLTSTTAGGVTAIQGWEYSISADGTQNINGSGNVAYAAGGFVIYNGTTWDYIAPVTGVSSIKFDGGATQTGAVLVTSSDIVSTINTGALPINKLAASSITVSAGQGLAGGGTVALGGTVTLSNAGVTSIAVGSNNVSGITLTASANTGSTTVSLSGSIAGLTTTNLSNSAGITNNQLANSTISGVALGGTLANLTAGTGITFSTGTTYNGSSAITISSTITQYTDTIARQAISLTSNTPTGTTSTLTYNNTTGVFVFTSAAAPTPQVNSDWNAVSGLAQILNKPTVVSAFTNDAAYITLSSLTWTNVTGKPTFATVATTGSYTDLINKPTIPAAQIQSDWNQTNNASLDYIKNKPTIPAQGVTTVAPTTLDSTHHVAGTISGTTLTLTTDATTANTANTIVLRDSYGNIHNSGWIVGTHVTSTDYTVTNNDFWIGCSAKHITITLPSTSENGRQYQIADTVHSGTPAQTITAASPATVVGNTSTSQQGQMVTATYVGGVWYCN